MSTAMVGPVTDALDTHAPPANIQQPQYMQGFEGIASARFGADAEAILKRKVTDDEVEIKPDGIVYLPGVRYRQRLHEAFGPGAWALVPRQPPRVIGTVVTYPGALNINGRYVADAMGECTYRENNPNMSYASAFEGAKTDALGRACKDLMPGVLCMWDPGWIAAWKEKNAEQYWGEVWDGRKQAKVKKQLWRRKDWEHRKAPDPTDLAAGAGGHVAPAAESTSTSTTTASNSAAASAASDTGEAATGEQKERIKALIKSFGWKAGYMRIWFASRFGDPFTPTTGKPVDMLSQTQAATTIELLETYPPDCNLEEGNEYEPKLAEMKAAGRVVG